VPASSPPPLLAMSPRHGKTRHAPTSASTDHRLVALRSARHGRATAITRSTSLHCAPQLLTRREGWRAPGVQREEPFALPSTALPYGGTGAAGAFRKPLGAMGAARCTTLLRPWGIGSHAWQPSTRRGQPVQRVDRSADCCVDWRTNASERSEQRAVRPCTRTTESWRRRQ